MSEERVQSFSRISSYNGLCLVTGLVIGLVLMSLPNQIYFDYWLHIFNIGFFVVNLGLAFYTIFATKHDPAIYFLWAFLGPIMSLPVNCFGALAIQGSF